MQAHAHALQRPHARGLHADDPRHAPHPRVRDRQPHLLRGPRRPDRATGRGVQRRPQREDARGRLQPRARALHNLRRGRPGRGARRPRARPDALDGLRRAHGDQERPLPARRSRARGAPALDAQARRAPAPRRLVGGRGAPGHHDEGPRGPEPHRLQAAGGRLGLHHGRHVVPGARVPPVREQPVGPVSGRHGRPSDPPRHLDPRARARAEQGHRLRQAAPQLDRQGGRGGPDERRQEGLRLHPASRRAALHARGGAGHVRAPQGRQPAPVPLLRRGDDLRAVPRGARGPGRAPRLDRPGQRDRARAAALPAARGPELRPAAGDERGRRGALHAHRRDSHPEPVRHPRAQRGGRRLLRPEPPLAQPRHRQPQEARTW